MLIRENMKMADLVHLNYLLVPLIRRFDIQLGFGDKNIKEVCKEKNINVDFFLEIVNTYCDKHHFPESHLLIFPIKLIVGYLRKSHHFYRNEKIPLIEKMINDLKWDGDEANDNKILLKKFFSQYKKEVNIHLDEEELTIYPYAVKLERIFTDKNVTDEILSEIKENAIKRYAEHHSNLEYKLSDLKNIIIKYLQPPDNTAIYQNVLFEIFKLEEELNSHAMIENKVLIPKIEALEKEILSYDKSVEN